MQLVFGLVLWCVSGPWKVVIPIWNSKYSFVSNPTSSPLFARLPLLKVQIIVRAP